MPELPQLLLFIAAGWLLNLTPGPDVLYIVSHGLRHGARAGMVAALGIISGCFVHVFAAAAGLSALLATSATAFTVLKWVGAAYLLWMGAKLLFSRGGRLNLADGPATETDLWAIWRRGFLTNVLNPKVALFFLAFVPQFIRPDAAHPALAFLLLGVLFNLNSLPINLGYAWLAAWAARRLHVLQTAMGWMDRIAGLMFIGFGLRLALAEPPTKP
jgi:threonine/homoserine/homoserine lactone efflux protein